MTSLRRRQMPRCEKFISRNGHYGISGEKRVHSGLMPANFATVAHFSAPSAISLPNSAGEPESSEAPSSASSAFALGSATRAPQLGGMPALPRHDGTTIYRLNATALGHNRTRREKFGRFMWGASIPPTGKRPIHNPCRWRDSCQFHRCDCCPNRPRTCASRPPPPPPPSPTE